MLVTSKELLLKAQEGGYAVGAFNVENMEMVQAVLAAAEEFNSPVIMQTTPSTVKYAGLDYYLANVEAAAKRTKVPVVMHLDHGNSFELAMQAMHAGYTSVMIDASSKPFEENVALTREVCRIAHAVDVSVEAELGTIGTTAQSMTTTSSTEIHYTEPEEATRFVAETGVDTLAIAIGTCHGIYPKGMVPTLQIQRLKDIKKVVPIPLVLHGGSANKDEEIAEAARCGINKINISSDIKDPFYQKCREVLQDPYIREPGDIYPPCIEVMKEVIRHKFDLLGTTGKAPLYYPPIKD